MTTFHYIMIALVAVGILAIGTTVATLKPIPAEVVKTSPVTVIRREKPKLEPATVVKGEPVIEPRPMPIKKPLPAHWFVEVEPKEEKPREVQLIKEKPKQPGRRNWEVGGNLHAEKISVWRRATYQNKLATCADAIAANLESLSPKMQRDINESMPHLKVYAAELVEFIDAACREVEDDINARRYLDDQLVAAIAAIGMSMMR
jgi:hypothetical protein